MSEPNVRTYQEKGLRSDPDLSDIVACLLGWELCWESPQEDGMWVLQRAHPDKPGFIQVALLENELKRLRAFEAP